MSEEKPELNLGGDKDALRPGVGSSPRGSGKSQAGELPSHILSEMIDGEVLSGDARWKLKLYGRKEAGDLYSIVAVMEDGRELILTPASFQRGHQRRRCAACAKAIEPGPCLGFRRSGGHAVGLPSITVCCACATEKCHLPTWFVNVGHRVLPRLPHSSLTMWQF